VSQLIRIKGFTLIELTAILLVLSVIAVVAIGKIESTKPTVNMVATQIANLQRIAVIASTDLSFSKNKLRLNDKQLCERLSQCEYLVPTGFTLIKKSTPTLFWIVKTDSAAMCISIYGGMGKCSG